MLRSSVVFTVAAGAGCATGTFAVLTVFLLRLGSSALWVGTGTRRCNVFLLALGGELFFTRTLTSVLLL